MEGIALMLEEAADPEEEKLLKLMDETLQSTGSFYEALSSTQAFPDYMLHMVQIGEYTGKLDEVMSALSSHYEREASISQSIKNAVTYPLIMVFMMLLVILVLVTKDQPLFQRTDRADRCSCGSGPVFCKDEERTRRVCFLHLTFCLDEIIFGEAGRLPFRKRDGAYLKQRYEPGRKPGSCLCTYQQ